MSAVRWWERSRFFADDVTDRARRERPDRITGRLPSAPERRSGWRLLRRGRHHPEPREGGPELVGPRPALSEVRHPATRRAGEPAAEDRTAAGGGALA